ncbi:ribonuclease H-like domain-containing protein [Tanacetum coccineum]
MVTRFRVGFNRPLGRLKLHVSSISPLPKSYNDAFNNTNCQNVMQDKYNALLKSNTWTLVPRPTDANIVYCMWLFRHKYLADGTLSHYKAHLVANGSTQIDDVDVDETFSLVVKPGISVMRNSSGMFLSQRKYATDILERAHMGGCNSSRTPVNTESKLGDDGDSVSDPKLYRNLEMRIGRISLPLGDRLLAIVYFFGNNLLSWSSKRQPVLSRSSAEAEYRGVFNAVAETCWLRNLLCEMHIPLSSATLVYCDNVRVLHVPSCYQLADIFPKGLPSALFEEFCTSLSVQCPPAPTAEEC